MRTPDRPAHNPRKIAPYTGFYRDYMGIIAYFDGNVKGFVGYFIGLRKVFYVKSYLTPPPEPTL